jgi:oxygen-independent coproporphyrinogen-3 oxidase
MILQLKLGSIDADYFMAKFGVNVVARFARTLAKLQQEGMLTYAGDEIRLTRRGLLRVDGLLPEFYHPEYQNARYT